MIVSYIRYYNIFFTVLLTGSGSKRMLRLYMKCGGNVAQIVLGKRKSLEIFRFQGFLVAGEGFEPSTSGL